MLTVCEYPAFNDAERRVKADYLLEMEAESRLFAQHTRAILRSLGGAS